jgi:nitroimidazol reductase NimA-like FMN-containing flavoprotein (pyridoxamine 5'-phosphate oxidase superfamily)
MRALAGGAEACLAVTHLDGLVLARSAFHHSLNYRSVVVFGTAEALEEPAEKLALRCLTERIVPGRWQEVRQPSEEELRQTLVVAIKITEESPERSAQGRRSGLLLAGLGGRITPPDDCGRSDPGSTVAAGGCRSRPAW